MKLFGKSLNRSGRVTTPSILQMEATECGAAGLAIILAYHGRYEPLAYVRQVCGVSRDGSKASKILAAARGFGLSAAALKRETEDLRTIRFPVIVHWNFDHFVVVEGFRGQKVYINDPAVGRRVIGLDEFDRSFTGIVLAFEPGAEFQRGGVPHNSWKSLRGRFRGHAAAVAYIFLAMFGLIVPSIALATLQTVFIDSVLIQGMTQWLRPLLLAMAGLAVALGVLTYLQQRSLLRIETRFSVCQSSRFFWHVLRLPLEFYAQRFAGEIGMRVTANEKLASLVSGELASSMVGILLVGSYVALLLQYDVTLAVLSICTVAVNLLALRLISRKRTDESRRLVQEQGKLMGVITSGLLSIETVKSAGGEAALFSSWTGHQTKVANAEQELAVASQLLAVFPPLLMTVNTAAILGIGGLRVMDGLLTIGMLVALQGLVRNFVDPVNRLLSLGSKLQEVQGDVNRLDDVLQNRIDSELLPRATTASITQLSGDVEFRNVSYGHNPLDPPLIEDFNLTIPAGKCVAVVGASGSGKSTIAKLLCGLLQPRNGNILFDGIPSNQIDREVITDSIALVDQEVVLFEGTVAENIALWDDTIEHAEIVKAAKEAIIHDAIVTKSGGYGYGVEEMARNLSGGQKQRIEIARALAMNPRILVLDEATSALDPHTEHLLNENIRRRGCTCLIVAHRLSTIRQCDEIIVLERGRIVERGTHASLVQRQGVYARLICEDPLQSHTA